MTVFQASSKMRLLVGIAVTGFFTIDGIHIFTGAWSLPVFYIHTQALGKWGWFEKIMVTPTHHGIHHASNPEYLDKNYGDVLIIWDKLFGTFAQEKKEVKIVYGPYQAIEQP
ncbi:MAG: sterol desaturase family protein [Bacteroidota bacterium]